MRVWAYGMQSRRRMQFFRKLGRLSEKIHPLIFSRSKRKRIPKLAEKTFGQLWEESKREDGQP
jgi:hypothetical protein